MTFKKKCGFATIIICAALIAGAALFKLAISPDLELSAENSDLIKARAGVDYNQLLTSCREFFNAKNISYAKSPYKIDDNKSYIKEEYQIRNIVLSRIRLSRYPLRADIEYDYSKTVYYKADTETVITPNQNFILLYDLKAGGNTDAANNWKSAVISLWIFPVVIIAVVFIITVIYNFLPKRNNKNNINLLAADGQK